MVEMDVVLGSFVKKYLHTLTATELTEYDVILKQFDNDLFNWLLMGAAPQEQVAALSVWTKIFNHVAENRNELIGYRV
jgi:succinate dehydrogenase flavin-adding protein (antitoxin of CptAB toxin-antitoxin module)